MRRTAGFRRLCRGCERARAETLPDPQLTVAHVDAEVGFSGGEAQVFLLMEGLRERGWRNVLLCPPGSAAEARARALDLDVRPVAMRNDLDGPAVLALRRAVEEERADLAHLHTGRATWLGGWAARLAGVPAITTRRMDRAVKRGLRTRLVYGTLTRRAAAISGAVAACLRAGGVEPERVRVIHSSVDPARLAPRRPRAEVRRELGAGEGDVVLLALGGLIPRKGHDVLLLALVELARRGVRPQLWIAGEGAQRELLERRVAELEGRARLLGRREDVPDLLGACDVVVMPSRREGLGVAALEAMAAGRPVVASAVGGLAEAVVDGGSGLLVPPGDPSALALALELVVLDAELRAQLGAGGRARVAEGYLAEQMVAAYDALYREVLAEVRG